MERDKGFRVIAIIALCFAIAGLSLGYAALNQDLNINGTATKTTADWDVHFVALSEPTIVGSAKAETAATLNATTVTLDVSVKKPGDSISYTFNVENGGDIDAKLNSVPVITGADTAATNDITVTLTHADGSALAANEALDAGNSTQLKLTVVFNSDAEEIAETDVELPISATLTYVQK